MVRDKKKPKKNKMDKATFCDSMRLGFLGSPCQLPHRQTNVKPIKSDLATNGRLKIKGISPIYDSEPSFLRTCAHRFGYRDSFSHSIKKAH